MRAYAQRSQGGKHRKVVTSQTTKGRVAFVAIAAGAASSAGIGGAAAATLQTTPAEQDTRFALTSDSTPLNADAVEPEVAETAEDLSAPVEQAAPQILEIAEYKPVTGIEEQVDKARVAAEERAAADAAARGPQVVRPAEGVFTSGYGMRWGSLHAGIDIAAPIGTPIYSVMDGVVISSGPASGYGNWIRVQHADGSISVYGHMISLDVAVGDTVYAGQKIADMGNEGFSTGPHLHFEIHPSGNGAIDPIPWFAERGIFIS